MFLHEPCGLDDLKTTTIQDHRYYITPSGKLYPSVTSVLGAASDTSWLEEWRNRIGHKEADRISSQARGRGTAIHSLCQKYLMNEENYLNKAMPTIQFLFNGIKPILDAHITKVRGVELALWSDRLRTAGRTDVFADWNSIPAIIDFKNTRSQYPKSEKDIHGYFLQTTCYALMASERLNMKVNKIVIILTNGLDFPQVFEKPINKYLSETVKIFTGREPWPGEDELLKIN